MSENPFFNRNRVFMASLKRSNWIQLYKDLRRAALQFPQYNYRHFAQRRVRDYFELHRSESDEKVLVNLYTEGQEALAVIKRQATISLLYPNRKLVIEPEEERTLI